MTPLVMELLRTRWGLFICAIVALGTGVIALIYTVPANFARIDGAVASYTVVNNSIGAYDHNELRLMGDPTIYKLDDGEYSPAPPHTLPVGAQVSIWVNQGHPWIMAIRIPDASGTGGRMYTTFPYEHPDQNLLAGRIVGSLFLLLGVTLVGMGLAWKRLPWRQRPHAQRRCHLAMQMARADVQATGEARDPLKVGHASSDQSERAPGEIGARVPVWRAGARFGPAAAAGAKACRFRRGGIAVEAHILGVRRLRGANGPAIDTCRRDGGHEEAIEPAVAALDCAVAALELKFHTGQYTPRWLARLAVFGHHRLTCGRRLAPLDGARAWLLSCS
jgi:hypothetical protein